MLNDSNLVGPKKLEKMFFEDLGYFDKKEPQERIRHLNKIKISNLGLALSFIFKKSYKLMPGIIKDIFFWSSVLHKSPSSKIFAKTKYDELRTIIDIKVSELTYKSAPMHYKESVKQTFDSGFYTAKLLNISALDSLIENVVEYANPSHAGARPYFKDGKDLKIEGSFAAYYDFSEDDCNEITNFLRKNLDRDFSFHLSSLAGYKCELKDISYSLGIVFGENSNSEMHQDTFSGIAKGFIYLQDISKDDAPFEYLEGTYKDANFRSLQTNKALMKDDFHSSGSTRLRGRDLEYAMNKYPLKSFTGEKGLFVLANTSGYHRKGAHNSTYPRITLNFEIKRKGFVGKFLINFFALITYKCFRSQTRGN